MAQCRKKYGPRVVKKSGTVPAVSIAEKTNGPNVEKQLGPVPETKYLPKAGKTIGPNAGKKKNSGPTLEKKY